MSTALPDNSSITRMAGGLPAPAPPSDSLTTPLLTQQPLKVADVKAELVSSKDEKSPAQISMGLAIKAAIGTSIFDPITSFFRSLMIDDTAENYWKLNELVNDYGLNYNEAVKALSKLADLRFLNPTLVLEGEIALGSIPRPGQPIDLKASNDKFKEMLQALVIVAPQARPLTGRVKQLTPADETANHTKALTILSPTQGNYPSKSEHNDAVETLHRLHQAHPDKPDYVRDLATATMLEGNFEEAAEFYRKALINGDDDPLTTLNLAKCLFKMADKAEDKADERSHNTMAETYRNEANNILCARYAIARMEIDNAKTLGKPLSSEKILKLQLFTNQVKVLLEEYIINAKQEHAANVPVDSKVLSSGADALIRVQGDAKKFYENLKTIKNMPQEIQAKIEAMINQDGNDPELALDIAVLLLDLNRREILLDDHKFKPDFHPGYALDYNGKLAEVVLGVQCLLCREKIYQRKDVDPQLSHDPNLDAELDADSTFMKEANDIYLSRIAVSKPFSSY